MAKNQSLEPERGYLTRRYEELGRPPLTLWGKIAEKHWRQNLPLLYAGLKESAALLPAVILAQENAKDRYTMLIEEGADPWEARELAMKEFLYLDPEPGSENEEPKDEELSENPLEDLANEQTATSAVEDWLNETSRGDAPVRHARRD